MTPTCWIRIDTPIGELVIGSDGEAIIAIDFPGHSKLEGEQGDAAILRTAAEQLHEYFRGERKRFDLPLAPRGTEFQRRVWSELEGIPFGETIAYRQLAERIGDPAACRAVGSANGRNPIPIVIPCHRVIGADGSLTGFGGGLEIKRQLLDLESPLFSR